MIVTLEKREGSGCLGAVRSAVAANSREIHLIGKEEDRNSSPLPLLASELVVWRNLWVSFAAAQWTVQTAVHMKEL